VRDPAEIGAYARAAARMSGLDIDEEWWPSVCAHLGTLLEHAAGLDSPEQESGESPAPVFAP
jgi:Protein of unknown function (DUF4089)